MAVCPGMRQQAFIPEFEKSLLGLAQSRKFQVTYDPIDVTSAYSILCLINRGQ
jgi:hypothetical protein